MSNRGFLLVFLSILTGAGKTHCQSPVFATTVSYCFGGSAKEDLYSGTPSLDGGYLMAGFSNSTDGDIDPQLAYDTTNIFVVKCDASGNKVWAKTYGGNSYDKARYITQDSDSNILVTGGTHSTDGDVTSWYGHGDLFVLKMDKEGNKIWFKNFGGSGAEGGRFIRQLASGNYLVAGYTTSHNFDVPMSRGIHDGWLLMIDTAGSVLWSQTYGGTGDDRMRHFAVTPDGGFIFCGSSTSDDMQVQGNHGNYDFWAGKTDSVGNLQWSYVYGGSAEDNCYDIISMNNGNYLVTGYTASADGDVSGYMGNADGWLISIDPSGTLLWQHCLGGSRADRLSRSRQLASGDVVTFGFSQSVDADLAGVNFNLSNNYWLVKMDVTGNLLWNYCTGGNFSDLGVDIAIGPGDSSFVMMGESNSTNGTVLNPHGDYDFWLVKIDIFTSLPPLPGTNPAWDLYYPSWPAGLVIRGNCPGFLRVELYDMTGKKIETITRVKLNAPEQNIPLPLLPAGVYMAVAESDGLRKVLRFAVLRE